MSEIVRTYVNEQGDTINVYDTGAEYNTTKKHIARGSTANLITKENALQYVQRRVEISQLAKIRALARKDGLDVDNATDEELLKAYSNSQERLWGKGYDLVMDAKSGRAIEGIFSKVIDEEKTVAVPVSAVFNQYNVTTNANVLELWRDVLEGEIVPTEREGE